MAEGRRDWREICKAVVNEQDQVKLLELMEELLAALGQHKSTASADASAAKDDTATKN